MGARILACVMKCLFEIGMRPQSFHNMYGEQPRMNDKEKEELRRRSSAVVRRLILGAFGVRNYDYFRTPNKVSNRGSPAHRPGIHLLRRGGP